MSSVQPRNVIFAFDGGATRVVALIRFLRRLEIAAGRPISTLASQFVGVSAGGLVALLMGMKGMTAEGVERQVFTVDNSRKLFDRSLWDELLPFQTSPIYDGEGKASLVYEFLASSHRMGDALVPTQVVTYNLGKHQSQVFCSDKTPEANVCKVAEATSAMPVYFPSVVIDGETHIDGGISANNMSMQAVSEGIRRWGLGNFVVVSIGTGQKQMEALTEELDWGLVRWWTQGHLLHLLDSAPDQLVTTYAKQIMGSNMIRVDGPMPKDIKFDDTSIEGRQVLEQMGDDWFDQYGTQVLQLIGVLDPVTSPDLPNTPSRRTRSCFNCEIL